MPIDPGTATIIAAGIGGLGQIGSSFFGARGQQKGQEQTNAFNAEQARLNREFQERIFRNRHTYEVEDLLRAGLNPVLSAKYGGGSVPTGAQAVGNNPKGHFTEAALGTARAVKEIGLLGAEIAKTKAEAAKAKQETRRLKGTVNVGGVQMPLEDAAEMFKQLTRGQTNARGFNNRFGADISRLSQAHPFLRDSRNVLRKLKNRYLD